MMFNVMDWFDITKLENESFTPEFSDINITQVVIETMNLTKNIVEEKNLQLLYYFSDSLPSEVRIDKNRY